VAPHRVTLDEARRAEAIEAGWRAYAEHLPGHEAAYRAACERWQVVAVVADEVIGALFVDGNVIHLGIVPEWRSRWASRRLLRQMLSYGKTTRMMAGESLAFVERIQRFDPGFGWKVRES
jgi:GNAT superfamily N-acetyltransferase